MEEITEKKIVSEVLSEISEVKTLLLLMMAQSNKIVAGPKLPQKEYAVHRNVTPNTIIVQMKNHLYDTPPGYTEPCYDNTGKRGSAMFYRDLADLYYSLNIKKCPEASDDLDGHTL